MPYPRRVITAAVQDVNVVRDFWDWAFGILGAIGGLAGVIAIFYAVRAQRDATRARQEVMIERRRQFELEILRDLVEAVDAKSIVSNFIHNPLTLRIYEQRVKLLSGGALPAWRKMLGVSTPDEVPSVTGWSDRLADAKAAVERLEEEANTEVPQGSGDWERDMTAARRHHDGVKQEFRADVLDLFVKDLAKAIDQRVDAPHAGKGAPES